MHGYATIYATLLLRVRSACYAYMHAHGNSESVNQYCDFIYRFAHALSSIAGTPQRGAERSYAAFCLGPG